MTHRRDGKADRIIRFYGFDDFAVKGEFEPETEYFLNTLDLESVNGWLVAECRHHEEFISDEDYTTYIHDLSTRERLIQYDHGG